MKINRRKMFGATLGTIAGLTALKSPAKTHDDKLYLLTPEVIKMGIDLS